jgi:hydroxypyruvate isomerase
VGAEAIHVMAGNAAGPEAERVFRENLAHACAAAADLVILIEPLNRHDAPEYFLRTTGQARAIIAQVGAYNLRLMFDCYHVGRTEGDVITRLADLLPVIGHIQFAGVPRRGSPDDGELRYEAIFEAVKVLGWTRPLGAEYRPGGPTEDTLGWLSRIRAG